MKYELQQVSGCEEDSLAYQYVKPGIQQLNQLAYVLIENNEFERSQTLLSIYLDARPQDPFPIATMGFWYFHNNNLNPHLCWHRGNEYYTQSIDLAIESEHKHSLALRQKHFLEAGRFLLVRAVDEESALATFMEGYELGKIQGFSDIYQELKNYISVLNKTDFVLDDVAASSDVLLDETTNDID